MCFCVTSLRVDQGIPTETPRDANENDDDETDFCETKDYAPAVFADDDDKREDTEEKLSRR